MWAAAPSAAPTAFCRCLPRPRAYLLRDVSIYGGAIQGELCTPTGAALLRHFVTRFGDMPVMTLESVGYGMGQKDFPRANCLRAMLGETAAESGDVVELACNLDDMTGEGIAFAMERLLAAGALDVYTAAIGMKKSRPGVMLCVLVPGGAAGGHGASAAAAHHHPGRPGDPAPAVYPVPQPGHRGLPLGPRGPENLPGLGRPAAEAGV